MEHNLFAYLSKHDIKSIAPKKNIKLPIYSFPKGASSRVDIYIKKRDSEDSSKYKIVCVSNDEESIFDIVKVKNKFYIYYILMSPHEVGSHVSKSFNAITVSDMCWGYHKDLRGK